MVNYRKGVMAVIVNDKGKFLIGSSPRDGGFKFPQGGLDEGETSLEGVKREVFEEIGLELSDSDIIERFDEKVDYMYPNREHKYPEFDGQEQFVFKIGFESSMKIEPQDDEFDKLIWISPNEFENYDFTHRRKAYRRALELCGLL